MRPAKIFLLTLLTAATIIGCSEKDKPKDQPAPSPARINLKDLNPILAARGGGNEFSAFNAAMAELEASPSDELKQAAQHEIDEALLAMFMNKHRAEYEKYSRQNSPTSDKVRAELLLALGDEADYSQAQAKIDQLKPHELKTQLEQAIDPSGDLVYNKAHISLFSPLELKKMQSYSGTSLYEVARRLKSTKALAKDLAVMIYENGHILPGYMQWNSQGWNLVGVEMTVSGQGKKIYGSIHNLKNVRVVDAWSAVA